MDRWKRICSLWPWLFGFRVCFFCQAVYLPARFVDLMMLKFSASLSSGSVHRRGLRDTFFWVACCKLKFATTSATVHIASNVVLITFLVTVFVSCRINSTKQISHLVADIPANHKVLDRQGTRVSARMRRNERQKTNERAGHENMKMKRSRRKIPIAVASCARKRCRLSTKFQSNTVDFAGAKMPRPAACRFDDRPSRCRPVNYHGRPVTPTSRVGTLTFASIPGLSAPFFELLRLFRVKHTYAGIERVAMNSYGADRKG